MYAIACRQLLRFLPRYCWHLGIPWRRISAHAAVRRQHTLNCKGSSGIYRPAIETRATTMTSTTIAPLLLSPSKN